MPVLTKSPQRGIIPCLKILQLNFAGQSFLCRFQLFSVKLTWLKSMVLVHPFNTNGLGKPQGWIGIN